MEGKPKAKMSKSNDKQGGNGSKQHFFGNFKPNRLNKQTSSSKNLRLHNNLTFNFPNFDKKLLKVSSLVESPSVSKEKARKKTYIEEPFTCKMKNSHLSEDGSSMSFQKVYNNFYNIFSPEIQNNFNFSTKEDKDNFSNSLSKTSRVFPINFHKTASVAKHDLKGDVLSQTRYHSNNPNVQIESLIHLIEEKDKQIAKLKIEKRRYKLKFAKIAEDYKRLVEHLKQTESFDQKHKTFFLSLESNLSVGSDSSITSFHEEDKILIEENLLQKKLGQTDRTSKNSLGSSDTFLKKNKRSSLSANKFHNQNTDKHSLTTFKRTKTIDPYETGQSVQIKEDQTLALTGKIDISDKLGILKKRTAALLEFYLSRLLKNKF